MLNVKNTFSTWLIVILRNSFPALFLTSQLSILRISNICKYITIYCERSAYGSSKFRLFLIIGLLGFFPFSHYFGIFSKWYYFTLNIENDCSSYVLFYIYEAFRDVRNFSSHYYAIYHIIQYHQMLILL